MIKGIILNIGLNLSPHDPCLLYGVLTDPSSTASASCLQSQLHVGLYVDGFVFYLSDPYQEALFKTLPQDHIQVNFMGNVEYFLGTPLLGSDILTEKSLYIYANRHSLNLLLVDSQSTQPTSFPT